MSEVDILEKEEKFHDDWAATIDIDKINVREYFSMGSCPENRYIASRLKDIKGKKLLELGCGAGEASVYFALQGADVTATDLSEGMLEVAKKLAAKNNTTISTQKVSANNIPFPDNSFDIVYTANTLHHVDLQKTVAEIFRILKPGGLLCSWDPLAHNPVINVYRRMAMGVRTEDEHPLRMKDLKLIKQYASKVDYTTTWFFTLWIFLKFYLIDRIDPNKERYWKKVLYDYKKIEKTYTFLEKIDNFVLKLFPFLRRYCWNIVIIAEK